MTLTANHAEQLALNFLMDDWKVPHEDREWFTVLTSRPIGESWYVVEIGVEGLPDKWLIQVYDTGECDPCYTFVSPLSPSESNSDLADIPDWIAQVLVSERKQR
ncbi:MAG TPA: hypothetical protein DCL61_16625 [Cyanobacteria bacterium UBA12227]|nr:hypothetical protein [Cyanobacteria bacterium UBA12227]HAX87926.1 hypothetical protein [Cyanobacteria bacterium UBA11370]HBY80820.1 hypothetical protein [Cyanobacteria bacterium UBA11148]